MTLRLRRLRATLGSVGLALALVAGQGGALLHELSHYAAPAKTASAGGRATTGSTQTPSPDQGKPCDLCLAFAQLAGALHSSTFASPLIADLRDATTAFDAPAVVDAATLTPRSRGPPALL